MRPSDYITTARDLVDASARGRPRETNLRRAVSTAYYALFHCLAACCADMLVGGAGARRSQPAWRQAYRALQHGTARNRCERRSMMEKFPRDIRDFAELFAFMQIQRHRADYDPDGYFYKDVVLYLVDEAADRIGRFGRVSVKDRRAFAVYVLLDIRGD